MSRIETKQSLDSIALVRAAALDQKPIAGLTHCFYRYPARFSPAFAGACIEAFSRPGQVVLDPYMGGGTTVVEALSRGRVAVGSDINSLAVFVTKAKTTRLTTGDREAIRHWAENVVPAMRCGASVNMSMPNFGRAPRNLNLPPTRGLRKMISFCLNSLRWHLSNARDRTFARCILLNVGQWALNGKKRIPTPEEFRDRVASTARDMLCGEAELSAKLKSFRALARAPILRINDAERIHKDKKLLIAGLADLVVTSPPYPGIHMLYHRWQVDGRKETDAPYWIAECNDGCGAAFYNFADRRRDAEDRYFQKAERSFTAVRRLMRDGAILAQMVAFAEPERQLRRYLRIMERAGFREIREERARRIWRDIPGRRWHANYKGDLASSREVVLLHVAM